MYALGPAALGLWAYISGKSLVPMLQLLHVRMVYVTDLKVATYVYMQLSQLTYQIGI